MTRLFAGTPFDIPPECEVCGRRGAECVCTPADKAAAAAQQACDASRLPPGKQTARVTLQKRKGKRLVTVVEGLTAAANDLPALLKTLQTACGSGGTVKTKENLLELQGDQSDRTRETLLHLGYKVK